MPYRSLDAEKIITTAERLGVRISERFPDSGLAKVSSELLSLAHDTRDKAMSLETPIWWLRAVITLAIFGGAFMFAFVGTFLSFDRIAEEGFDLVQGIEALINTLVLAGIGFVTLLKSEERIKRSRAMEGLHTLRSIIHVIDMHQLTKDPVVFNKDFKPTASSPSRVMSRADLSRYLDYCSEMLAITGKLAALYAQSLPDTEIADAVNDVEMLGSNLSRKIWQKIMLNAPANGRANASARRAKAA